MAGSFLELARKRLHGVLARLGCRRRAPRVVVFSRLPVPGKAKTRLIGALTEAGAAQCQRIMTERLLARCADAALDYEVRYTGGSEGEMRYWLGRRRPGARLRPQAAGGLGERLLGAAADAFSEGVEAVVIVGSDIPDVSAKEVDEAIRRLGECDMVLGPAEDGGYYLIGLHRRASARLAPLLLEGIEWGTEKVREQQLRRAEIAGVRSGVLETVLGDVDTEADLATFERSTGVARSALRDPTISVVIPVMNERAVIAETLARLEMHEGLEVVVADGGSSDGTAAAVEESFSGLRARGVRAQLVRCSRAGRGAQLAAGAAAARGDVLFFLHADSWLPPGWPAAAGLLRRPGVAMGAFRFGLRGGDGRWLRLRLAVLAYFTNVRAARLELPYGDQCYFIRREVYDEIGGFRRDYPMMEDVGLVDDARKIGHVAIADLTCSTSCRRWQRYGVLYTTAVNWCVMTAYRLGASPPVLFRYYYGRPPPKHD